MAENKSTHKLPTEKFSQNSHMGQQKSNNIREWNFSVQNEYTWQKKTTTTKKTFICIQKSFPSFSKRAESFHAISCVVNFLLAPLFYVFFHALLRSVPFKTSLIIFFPKKLAKYTETRECSNDGKGNTSILSENKYMSHCIFFIDKTETNQAANCILQLLLLFLKQFILWYIL
jgi:hypothetical protein